MPVETVPIVNYYLAGLLLNAIISLGIAVVAFRLRRNPGALWLGLFLLAVVWWSLVLFAEFSVTALPAKIFWAKMEYLGSMSGLIFLLFFAMEFSHAQQYFKHPYWLLYLIIPVITIGLVWTNEYHQLIWTSFTPVDIPGSNAVIFGHGPFFGVVIGYVYLGLLAITLLFLRATLAYRHIHRRQAGLMVATMVAPWLANVAYIFNLGLPGWDFTPFGFALTGLLLVFNITRWQFLDLTPVARDRVIEKMQQGVVMLDARQRIVDINPAALYILHTTPAVIGRSFATQFPDCAAILAGTEKSQEIEWPGRPRQLLSISTTPLYDRRRQITGYVILCQDITRERQKQQELWDRQIELAVLEERQQLSKDLHAQTGQVLGQIVTLARNATSLLEEEHYAATATALAQLIEIARGSGIEIDEFVKSLQPVAASPDFFEALAQYTDHFSQSRNLSVTLTHPPQPANDLLSPMVQIQLLHIIQATLDEEPPTAQIIISVNEGWVQTIIARAGIEIENGNEEKIVLSAIRQRAEAMGGTVEVRAGSEASSHLIIQLPRRKHSIHVPMTAMRVLMVDDHEIMLEGFRELLEDRGIEVVGAATNGAEAIEQARRLKPDVILMDVRMPGMSGIEATRHIKAELPDIKIVILTVSQDRHDLFDALRNGADGYLLKTLKPKQFFELLNGVLAGEAPLAPAMVNQLMTGITRYEDAGLGVASLSRQQLEILRLVTRGLTYSEVGNQLHLAERTVRYHMDQIKEKLNVSSRSEVVAEAVRLGIVEQA